jgi:cysteinyl-tRNA synthetase
VTSQPDAAVAEPFLTAFTAAMDDDLNVPVAIATLHDLVSAGNERLPAAEAGKADARRRWPGSPTRS